MSHKLNTHSVNRAREASVDIDLLVQPPTLARLLAATRAPM
jgi:hypothetical protein